MKTKYKILIVSTMILAILTCFMITSFAVYSQADITYDSKTYTYNTYYNGESSYQVQLWGYDTIKIYKNNVEIDIHDSPNIIIESEKDSDIDMHIYYFNNGSQTYYSYNDSGSTLTIVYTGELKLAYLSSSVYNPNATDIYVQSDPLTYDVYQNSDLISYDNGSVQINLLNNNEPTLNDKVTDFLNYLSTSITKITTMIIANQILILFIVAVPVVSFVIGSFKRIKDSGRV